MNGVTGTGYRPSITNLGTITEENNIQNNSTPKTVQAKSLLAKTDLPGGEGEIISKVVQQPQGELLKPEEKNGTQNNRPLANKNKIQSDQSILSSDLSQGDLGGDGQNQRKGDDGPKFTISETSEDSDTSTSPPKGKFYI